MSSTVYDFAIIGAGAAGLHLAQTMLADDWFAQKKILVLEKDNKDTDDRTWSFWEKGTGKWDHLIAKNWGKGQFITNRHNVELSLFPYKYKMLHAIDFYNYGKQKLAEAPHLDWIKEEVKTVTTGEIIEIKCSKQTYQAKQVFDSRIDADFKNTKDKYHRVIQHFKGWVIETKEPVFDPTTFVMMDYRLKWKDSTSFTYVLPTSSHSAMIEFTLFNLEYLEDAEYDRLLKKYIKDILKIDDYTISKVEYGVIPMSNYPFHKANQPGIMKIGTAGSWVKPSSGYAFKNIEKMAGKVVENIKQGRDPSTNLFNARFQFYDTLYLGVLSKYNDDGETLFETMYTKNSIQKIFKFLDEETNILEEIKIMSSFNPKPFLEMLLNETTGIGL
ncbi:MAG: lycopene beta-cyclase [Paraglaciecola sp.]|jgi:lycopene beta-cyclase